MYTFTEPISLAGLLLSFLTMLTVLVYLTYFFHRRKRILEFKKLPTLLIVGLPNTGRSFLMKALAGGRPTFFDKLLNFNYVDLDYNGKLAVRILDHVALSSHQVFDKSVINDMKNVNPLAIIGVIDVSKYSDPLEKQIEFILKMREFFSDKPFYIVANKIDETSESKVRKIEEQFGKVYRIRWNSPEDVLTLKKDILKFLGIPSQK